VKFERVGDSRLSTEWRQIVDISATKSLSTLSPDVPALSEVIWKNPTKTAVSVRVKSDSFSHGKATWAWPAGW